mmetsp:Transcript_1134/g.2540  ORF Transcript_1134/g.2540 Transcript_1134/m.2540 type:complete len:236 (+) Transcript_1134:73-780(+)
MSKLWSSLRPPRQQKTWASRVGVVIPRCGAGRGQVFLGLLPLLCHLLKHGVHLGQHLFAVLFSDHVRASQSIQHLVRMKQTAGKQVPGSEVPVSSQGSRVPQYLRFVRGPHEVRVAPWLVLVGLGRGVPKSEELLPPLLSGHRRRSVEALPVHRGRGRPGVPLLAGLRPLAGLPCVASCLRCHAPHGCIHVIVTKIPRRQRHPEGVSFKSVPRGGSVRLIYRDSIVHRIEKPSPP